MNSLKDAVEAIKSVLDDVEKEQIEAVINIATKSHTGAMWLCALVRYASVLHESTLLARKTKSAIPSPLYIVLMIVNVDHTTMDRYDYKKSIMFMNQQMLGLKNKKN